MKLLLLADPVSSHIQKWANSLYHSGIDVAIFGLSSYNSELYHKEIKIEVIDFSKSVKLTKDGNLLKSIYVATLPKLKSLIKKFKPDIIHAHSASSYGLLGALTNFHPYLISIWGSDVYLFPKKSLVHRKIFEFSLSKADLIFSTSKAMKSETQKYTDKEIFVLPFGVDTSVFKPNEMGKSSNNDSITIGTVKTLDYNYGIDLLLKAFKEVRKNYTNPKLKLLIVGGGGMEHSLKKLSMDLEISVDTTFTGFINHKDVVKYHNMLDISIFPSISESFGVSVLEASACEKPVITSDVGGLPETVENGVTGFIFPSQNLNLLIEKIVKLIDDKNLRITMGKAGRERVKKYFEWKDSVNKMLQYYENVN